MLLGWEREHCLQGWGCLGLPGAGGTVLQIYSPWCICKMKAWFRAVVTVKLGECKALGDSRPRVAKGNMICRSLLLPQYHFSLPTLINSKQEPALVALTTPQIYTHLLRPLMLNTKM